MQDMVKPDDMATTYYCDYESENISALAKRLSTGAGSAADIAEKTVRWVRDEIPFGFDFIKVKASETLIKGYGACFNKSLLLTALLRAQGIAARFCTVPVRRRFMKPYIGMKHLLINHPYQHCLVRLKLGDAWLYAEPTLDRKTYDAIFKPLGVKWGIGWNTEVQERLYLEHLLGDPVEHHDVDEIISRNVGNSMMPDPVVEWLCNGINRSGWRRAGVKPLVFAMG